MKIFFCLFFFLSSCSLFPPKASNEIDELAEQVIKNKEGVEITLKPLAAEKPK